MTNMYDLDFYAASGIVLLSPVNTSNRGAVRSSWKKRVFGPILVQTALILKKKINQSNLIKKISWACGPAAGPIGPAAAAAAPPRPRPQRSTPHGDGVMCGLDGGTMTINASLSFFALNEVNCVFVVMDIIPVWTSKPAGGKAEVIDEY